MAKLFDFKLNPNIPYGVKLVHTEDVILIKVNTSSTIAEILVLLLFVCMTSLASFEIYSKYIMNQELNLASFLSFLPFPIAALLLLVLTIFFAFSKIVITITEDTLTFFSGVGVISSQTIMPLHSIVYIGDGISLSGNKNVVDIHGDELITFGHQVNPEQLKYLVATLKKIKIKNNDSPDWSEHLIA